MKWLRAWPAWIALAHAVIGLAYGAVVPPWEGYDETGHFAYVQRLADGRGLPNRSSARDAILDQSHQPPLYYALAALPATLIDRTDDVVPQVNVFATDGTNRHGVRQFLRTPNESWPWHGTVLALHLARMFSTLLGTLNVLLIAALAMRVLGQGSAAIFATSIAAFNPQALFMGALVNNDVLINLFGSAVALAVVSLASKPSLRRALLLGALMGVSLWAKRTGLSVLLATGFAVAALALVRRWPWRTLITIGLAALAACVLTIAPLAVSNLSRFGTLMPDREAVNKIVVDPGIAGGGVVVALRDGWLLRMLDNAFRTFWGGFGWGNVKLPEWAFAALYLICAVGLIGLLLGAFRRMPGISSDGATSVGLLAYVAGIALLPTVRALGYHDQSLLVGRYLLPAMGPIACAIAFGWREIAGRWQMVGGWWTRASSGVLMAGCACAALAVPVFLLRPLYVTGFSIGCNSNSTGELRFEKTAQVSLLSAEYVEVYDLALKRTLPFARVVLRWHSALTNEQLAVGVSVLGRNNEVLGTENKYPRGGNYPSTLWQFCDTFDDEYLVELSKRNATLPARGRISVALFVPGQPITRTLAATDPAGKSVAPIIGEFRVPAYNGPTPDSARAGLSSFAPSLGNLTLANATVNGQTVRPGSQMTLSPQTPIAIEIAYINKGSNPRAIGFVHLLDASGKLIAQDDHAPANGDFPVDYWLPGDAHIEQYKMSVPSGSVYPMRLVTGMYSANSQERFETNFEGNAIELLVVNGP